MADKKGGRGMGAVAAVAAAAAAGYYFYASEDAAKNRKIAAKWAGNMKNDVVKQAKKLQDIDKKDVMKLVDTAVAAYASAKVDPKELLRAAKELKNNWQKIAVEVGKSAKKSATKTAKTVNKSAKRAVKKASK